MKKLPKSLKINAKTVFLVVFISLTTFFACKSSLPKGELIIKDYTQAKPPDVNLSSHKPFDVNIYKTTFIFGLEYEVVYYRNESGKLNYHTAGWGTEEDYDKAAYSWINDSTVSIRLYNTKTKKEAKFKVWGNGSSNSLDHK